MSAHPFFVPLVLSCAIVVTLPSCQSTGKGGDSGEFAFDDYPFDEQGNYIERSAAGMRSPGGRKPVKAAANVPPPPMPDPSYEVVDVPPVAAAPPSRPSTPSRPAASSSSSRPAPAATRSHTVKSGDTLWGISRKYNTSVKGIKDANGLKSDLIRVGQTLRIPR